MPAPQSIRERHTRDLPSLDALHQYVRSTLAPWCNSRDYVLTDRVKQVDSVAEKIETGRYERWSELDDLVAFSIVVPTGAHETLVIEMLDQRFERAVLRSRGTASKPPDVFRFDTTRWYGRVRSDPPVALDARATEAVFEVQVRTVFEHAWSTVTHDLVYKGDRVDWKARRLAAQLKAAVEQADQLVDHFTTSAETITPSEDARTDIQLYLVDAMSEMIALGLISESLTPESWQRFGECVYDLARRRARNARQAADLVRQMIDELRDDIESGAFVPAISGSLFQAIVAQVVQRHGVDAIGNFPIVAEGELASIYRLEGFRAPFDLDG